MYVVEHLRWYDAQNIHSLDGHILPDEKVASPCGLYAKYIFNGTNFILLFSQVIFSYISVDSFVIDGITADETDIALPGDQKYRFKRPDNYLKNSWLDMENGIIYIYIYIRM